jgi:hypothetical protein
VGFATRIGGPVGLKSKGIRAPRGLASVFGVWGARENLASDSQIEDLWICGYMAKWISRLRSFE